MRIAILNWSNRRFGGTGTYLDEVMPRLQRAGHDLALWHEVDAPNDCPVMSTPLGAPVWSQATLGVDAALRALRAWCPTVLYSHGLLEPSVENRLLDIAPAVFFAHNYYGTCISGVKTLSRPDVTPCNRRFGWQCLAEYYPRRCGGLNPITMVGEFKRQRSRLDLLSRYAAIVTHSTHMQREYVKHGLNALRVFIVSRESAQSGPADTCARAVRGHDDAWRLLFVGRMASLKGGRELLEALPSATRRLGRSLHVTLAGDGPQRASWEVLAADLCRREPGLRVEFPGWLERELIAQLYGESDLLVVPSLWPEPLALVGLEAAKYGLPAVAFDVGGVSDWLTSGVNGFLAPGDPPTAEGLADAIVSALQDPGTYVGLRHEAGRLSAEGSFDAHVDLVLKVFHNVATAA